MCCSRIIRLADALADEREAGKVRHELEDPHGQRIYRLALGDEDANGGGRLTADPMHKLLLGPDSLAGGTLASQPTLSQFENGVTGGELLRMSDALFEAVVTGSSSHRFHTVMRRAWHDVQNPGPWHGNPTRNSARHEAQRSRANPCSSNPPSRKRATTVRTTGRATSPRLHF